MNIHIVYTTFDHCEKVNTLLREGKQNGYVTNASGSIFFLSTKLIQARYVFSLDENNRHSSILLLKLSGYSVSKGPAVKYKHLTDFAVY